MRLPFLVVAASLVSVGAHAEPTRVRPARPSLAGPTEVPTKQYLNVNEPNKEERIDHDTIFRLVSEWVEHGSENFLQDLEGVLHEPTIDSESENFEPIREKDASTKELIRLMGINKETGENDGLAGVPEAFQHVLLKPPIEVQPSSNFLKLSHKVDDETAKLRQMLQLDKSADSDQIRYIFKFWKIYVSYFNARFFEHKISLYEALRDVYNDKGVAKIVADVKDAMTPAEIVLYVDFLKLQRPDENIFDNPQFSGLTKKLKRLIKNDPKKKKKLVDLLEYDDNEWLDMAYRSNPKPLNDPKTESVMKALYQSWCNSNLTPQGLFARLGLNMAENINFESPCFQEWIKYAIIYERKNKMMFSYILVLLEEYKENGLLKILQEGGKTPTIKRLAMDLRAFARTGGARYEDYVTALNSLIRSIKKPPLYVYNLTRDLRRKRIVTKPRTIP